MNHLSHRFNNTGKQEENAGLRPWSNQKCEASSRKVTSLHPKTSAQPHSASPAAPGAWQGCSWTEACADDSHRVVLPTLQELGGAGPPPGVSGWHRWCGGLQAWICLRVPCGKGRKVGNGLEFGLMKKMSSTNCTM